MTTPVEWRDDLAAFNVHDTASAEMFIYACERYIGLGFHPDTSGANYVDSTGGRTFTDEQADAFDGNLFSCFALLDDVYQVSLDEMHRLHPEMSTTGGWTVV